MTDFIIHYPPLKVWVDHLLYFFSIIVQTLVTLSWVGCNRVDTIPFGRLTI